MKSFIYLDMDTINSYIAQIDDKIRCQIRCLTPLIFINVVICIDEFGGLCYCYSKFVSVLDERGAGEK